MMPRHFEQNLVVAAAANFCPFRSVVTFQQNGTGSAVRSSDSLSGGGGAP